MTKNNAGTYWEALVKSGEVQTEAAIVGPGIFLYRGLGNAYLVTTADGNVLVNAGVVDEAPRGKELFDKVSTAALIYAILTQSHANQFGSLEAYLSPHTKLITHRRYVDGRAYAMRLRPYYSRRADKLWSTLVGSRASRMPTREFTPDILVEDRLDIDLGGRRFEIISIPGGETRDAMIVWLPENKVAITGNLFGPIFGHQPNLNTVRGDKPRSALEFIESAKTVLALAPDTLLTGHETVTGGDFIRRKLNRVIDAVQWLHDATIERMNVGVGLYQMMREIQLPDELKLGEGHGKVAWNVRAIWSEYTGWFDYEEGTTALYDIPFKNIYGDLLSLAGGASQIVACARDHVDAGHPIEALHLVNIALAAEPMDGRARKVKLDALHVLLERAAPIGNVSELMWLRSEIEASI